MRDEFDDEYYAADGDAPAGWRARFRVRYGEQISTWTGALAAVLVISALAIWVYNLGDRDANAVPVIRAALEPAKVQPDDPGGAESAYQDIASYGATDETNDPDGPIILAPPSPGPTDEDVAMGELQSQGGEEVAALTTESASGEGASADAAVDGTLPGDGTDLAPGYSPLALARPRDFEQRTASARQESSQEDALALAAATSIVQIQLGAFPTRAETKEQWEKIYNANSDILTGRALVVQSTISGGRRFFRMRAGPFKDRTEARNLCRALQARGQDCLVAVNG